MTRENPPHQPCPRAATCRLGWPLPRWSLFFLLNRGREFSNWIGLIEKKKTGSVFCKLGSPLPQTVRTRKCMISRKLDIFEGLRREGAIHFRGGECPLNPIGTATRTRKIIKFGFAPPPLFSHPDLQKNGTRNSCENLPTTVLFPRPHRQQHWFVLFREKNPLKKMVKKRWKKVGS